MSRACVSVDSTGYITDISFSSTFVCPDGYSFLEFQSSVISATDKADLQQYAAEIFLVAFVVYSIRKMFS